MDGAWDVAQSAEFAKRIKALGCDFIHVSSGGTSPMQKITIGPGYQVPFARHIRQATGMTTTAVGLITQPQQAEDILQAGDADLIALAEAQISGEVEFHVSRFEQYIPKPGAFRLVASAQAWHWVDPYIGFPKVQAALAVVKSKVLQLIKELTNKLSQSRVSKVVMK